MTISHFRQLDAIASRFLDEKARLLGEMDDLAPIDLSDTIVEVHGPGNWGFS